ncbi:MAG: trigger factor [Luteitalea sp.]|nr:trigger factor [Luteitalea sp.]
MKVDLIDISETEKTLDVEVPSTVVETEITRVAGEYARSARLPGFRPGRAPLSVIRRRYKQQILSDVAERLVSRAVDEALREREVEPVDTPRVSQLSIEEGQPLTFSAAIETVPPIDPGDYAAITLRRPPITTDEDEVDKALSRLRERAARFEPIEDRDAQHGDTVIMDVSRRRLTPEESEAPAQLEDASAEIGSAANPRGFDEALLGVKAGDAKTFTLQFPPDDEVEELRGAEMEYSITVKALRRRILPTLDNEFAKDLGEFDSLDALRARVREDLTRHAELERSRAMRQELLRQLAARVSFDVPEVLVERELGRRAEEFVRRLKEQRIDPTQAGIDWDAFRDEQREGAAESVKAVLVVDAIARREALTAEASEIDAEIDRVARQAGLEVDRVRRHLEHEGDVERLAVGIRRDKAIDLAMARATIVDA